MEKAGRIVAAGREHLGILIFLDGAICFAVIGAIALFKLNLAIAVPFPRSSSLSFGAQFS